MPCSSCTKKGRQGLAIGSITEVSQPYPFRAKDIYVIDVDDSIRKFDPGDWPSDFHKLLVFIPETFTPVCETEIGALNKYIDAFHEQKTDVYIVCTDPPQSFVDWFKQEESLQDRRFLVFSSYELPQRLGVVESGRAKRSSVIVTNDGEVIKQEHFHKVGRSFEELHRMIYGYNTDSYCAEGWKSPKDGFLK